MVSKKIKFIALASVLSAGVLGGTAIAGSYSPNLAKAKAPSVLRRANIQINNQNGVISAGQISISSLDGSAVCKDYAAPFNIGFDYNADAQEFVFTLNAVKTDFSVANIQSMCALNDNTRLNPYNLSFQVGNQKISSNGGLAEELYSNYKDVDFMGTDRPVQVPNPNHDVPGGHDPGPGGGHGGEFDPGGPGGPGGNSNATANYFKLDTITEDVTTFKLIGNKMFGYDISSFVGGISFIYGCENR